MVKRIPPQGLFAVSAAFHYLGPSFAVLLFERVEVLGVAWLRVATAGLVFALWRRPWERLGRLSTRSRRSIVALGIVLAAMNASFYLAIDRLTALHCRFDQVSRHRRDRSGRNEDREKRRRPRAHRRRRSGDQHGSIRRPVARFAFAFGNCALFVAYLIVGHGIANPPAHEPECNASSIDALALAMFVAAAVLTPIGFGQAIGAFSNPLMLLAGFGVGVASSVIPYVTDQLAMARLPRASFALMLALLPVFAVVIGAIVLHQIPTFIDGVGIAMVAGGVALHQAAPAPRLTREAS